MFLENRAHTFLDIVKSFTKTKFQINFTWLGQLDLLELSRALPIWTQYGGNLHDKYAKVFLWKIFGGSIWSVNDEFCWVMGNVTSQMQQFKNTGEGLLISPKIFVFSVFYCRKRFLSIFCRWSYKVRVLYSIFLWWTRSWKSEKVIL